MSSATSDCDVRRIRQHINGCVAPFVDKECDCPPERIYVPIDEVARVLRERGHTITSRRTRGAFYMAADVVEEVFDV